MPGLERRQFYSNGSKGQSVLPQRRSAWPVDIALLRAVDGSFGSNAGVIATLI
jgi:hypothetical protein